MKWINSRLYIIIEKHAIYIFLFHHLCNTIVSWSVAYVYVQCHLRDNWFKVRIQHWFSEQWHENYSNRFTISAKLIIYSCLSIVHCSSEFRLAVFVVILIRLAGRKDRSEGIRSNAGRALRATASDRQDGCVFINARGVRVCFNACGTYAVLMNNLKYNKQSSWIIWIQQVDMLTS